MSLCTCMYALYVYVHTVPVHVCTHCTCMYALYVYVRTHCTCTCMYTLYVYVRTVRVCTHCTVLCCYCGPTNKRVCRQTSESKESRPLCPGSRSPSPESMLRTERRVLVPLVGSRRKLSVDSGGDEEVARVLMMVRDLEGGL